MGKLSARKKRVKQRVKIGKVAPETAAHVESLDALVEALQLLIPLGLQAVTDELNPLAKQYLTVAISGFKHGSYVLPEVFSEVHLRSDLHVYPRT